MHRRRIVALSIAASLLAGLIAAPASTARPHRGFAFGPGLAANYGIQVEKAYIPTKYGTIYARIAHPIDTKGNIVRGPAVLTYSPYWELGTGGAEFRRTTGASHWTPMGYHTVWADVVGTGNSGGCYDYGGIREKVTAAAVVEWIAKQKWSTGKVGMIGASYEGTTANAAAVMQPKHLTTIVPEAAIDRWYDYAYEGGIRYFDNNEDPSDEGFDTPAGFDFGLAVPPPLDPDGQDWAQRFQENVTPCDEIQHTQYGYDDTPDYDKFWLERDYLKDAANVHIPVLVAANWGDWNVKQVNSWRWYWALKNSEKRVLYMGDRYTGHGTPDGDYDKYVDAWMAHYLMGVDNGIQNSPSIVSEGADYDGELKYVSQPSEFKTKDVALSLMEMPLTGPEDYSWKMMPGKPQAGPQSSVASWPSANINTESHALHHARSDHDWFWFESPMLKNDTRIFGQPKVRLRIKTDRQWVTLTPTVVDVDMDCMQYVANQMVMDPQCTPRDLHSVTRGWLDSRYRNGLAKQQPMELAKGGDLTVVEHPTDYTFKKGHVIGLMVSTEINEWSLPKPYPCQSADCPTITIDWQSGKSQLVLPIVHAPKDPMDLFDMGMHMH